MTHVGRSGDSSSTFMDVTRRWDQHRRQPEQDGQQQSVELADQSEAGESRRSLSLTHREYNYKHLMSWWQNIEQEVHHPASDKRRRPSCNADIERYETPSQLEGCGSESQEQKLEQLLDAMRDAEDRVQTAGAVLEGPIHSSHNATPETFAAEKLHQLVNATREAAQHLLASDVTLTDSVIVKDHYMIDARFQHTRSPVDREVESKRQKLRLLDDVVAEHSLSRLAPHVAQVSKRSMEETDRPQCFHPVAAVTCASTTDEGTEEGEDENTTVNYLAENLLITVPNTTVGLTRLFSAVHTTDEELLDAGATKTNIPVRPEVSSTAVADELPDPQHAVGLLTTDETQVCHGSDSPVESSKKAYHSDLYGSHLDVNKFGAMPPEFPISACHRTENEIESSPARSHLGASRPNSIDGMIARVQDLLRHPLLSDSPNRNAVNDVEVEMSNQIAQIDVVTATIAPSQQNMTHSLRTCGTQTLMNALDVHLLPPVDPFQQGNYYERCIPAKTQQCAFLNRPETQGPLPDYATGNLSFLAHQIEGDSNAEHSLLPSSESHDWLLAGHLVRGTCRDSLRQCVFPSTSEELVSATRASHPIGAAIVSQMSAGDEPACPLAPTAPDGRAIAEVQPMWNSINGDQPDGDGRVEQLKNMAVVKSSQELERRQPM